MCDLDIQIAERCGSLIDLLRQFRGFFDLDYCANADIDQWKSAQFGTGFAIVPAQCIIVPLDLTGCYLDSLCNS